MIQIKLDLDYVVLDNDGQRYRDDPSSITQDIILFAFAEKYPWATPAMRQGENKDKSGVKERSASMIVGAVAKELRKAAKNKATSIELPLTQAKAVRSAVADWGCDVFMAAWKEHFLEHLEPLVEAETKKATEGDKKKE